MSTVIGLDLGTTHVKALALDGHGRAAAQAQQAVDLQTPQARWAQQDATDVEAAAMRVLRDVARQMHDAPAAICLSGAMHSLLALDARDQPLGAAMTWADLRAAVFVRGDQDTAAYQRTGCPAHASYHPARLRWWAQQPQRDRVRRFVALKDWLLHRLSGVWATDASLASSTGLFDIHQRQWCDAVLHSCQVNAEALPAVHDSRQIVGRLTEEAARQTGLPRDVQVICGGSDGGLANLGAAGAAADRVVITVGTSAAIRWNVAEPRLDPQRRTWCYLAPGGGYLAGGAINNAGLAVGWVADRFYGEQADPVQALMNEAAAIAPGADGLVMLPYLSGGERSPLYRSDLRAALLGLTLRHQRGHIARAVLESVAYSLAQVWDILSPPAHRACLTGGITRQPAWGKILADVLGVTMEPLVSMDASARGAAVLGHSVLGRELPAVEAEPVIEPDGAANERYRVMRMEWERAAKALQGRSTG